MTARRRGTFAIVWRLTIVVGIALAATVLPRPSTANAKPVEYVQICTIYGAEFLYLPGTDICANFATNDAREQAVPYPQYLVSQLPACPASNVFVSDATDGDCTAGDAPEGGGDTTCGVTCVGGAWQFTGATGVTWRWRIPNNPRTWVSTPQLGCQSGQLVKFGDITGSGLTLNSHSRYETKTHYPLKLKQGQYIASVLYKGGLTIPSYRVSTLPSCPAFNTFVTDASDTSCTQGDTPIGGGSTTCEVACVSGEWEFTGEFDDNSVGQGNFCMFYYYTDPVQGPVYSFPLGCIDTSPQAALPATLVFSPDTPIPSTSSQTYVLGANGDSWEVPSATSIQGTLSVWLCFQQAPNVGPGH